MSKYIREFDKFDRRCDIDEPETVTIARFRREWRSDIREELYLREVHYLVHASQIARDYERFPRRPVLPRPEPPMFTIPNPKPGSSQTSPG